MKNRIDEHDMTKKMMSIVRGGYKNLLTEDEGFGGAQAVQTAPVQAPQLYQQSSTPNEIPQQDIGKEGSEADAGTLNDELTKMRQQVDPSVKIDSFKLYPNAANVTITGTLLNGKIDFIFNLVDNTANIDTETIELDDISLERIQKMKGYFQNWKDDWSKKINTEYKSNS